MDPDGLAFWILALVGLVAASAYFVAAEFAILTLRRRRVEQIAMDGAGRSPIPTAIAERSDELSLVAQLGSLLSLLLAGLIAARLGVAIVNGLVATAALAVGLLAASVLFLVLGQQIPRLIGAQRPSWMTTPAALWPLRVTAMALRPVLTVLSTVLNRLAEAIGLTRSAFYVPLHTLDDLRELLVRGHEHGVVEADEREMIHGVFEFAGTVAREVMTPRIDIIAVATDVTLEQLIETVVGAGHSRIPVFEDSIDSVVGVVLAKDLLQMLAQTSPVDRTPFSIATLMREPYFAPDSKPVAALLSELRQASVHLAIVVDEFGGTSGLVTMEDLLEEIVGEISDEYDFEEPDFFPTPEGDVLIDGGAAISDVNERFGLALPEDDFDTIGGYIFGSLGRVPVSGDSVDQETPTGGVVLEVEEAEERRVTRVRLRNIAKKKPSDPER